MAVRGRARVRCCGAGAWIVAARSDVATVRAWRRGATAVRVEKERGRSAADTRAPKRIRAMLTRLTHETMERRLNLHSRLVQSVY